MRTATTSIFLLAVGVGGCVDDGTLWFDEDQGRDVGVGDFDAETRRDSGSGSDAGTSDVGGAKDVGTSDAGGAKDAGGGMDSGIAKDAGGGMDSGGAEDTGSGMDSGGGTDAGGGVDTGGGGGTVGEHPDLKGILAAHNAVRDTVGTAHLVWDDELEAIAQSYSEKCIWGHNPKRSDDYPGYVGENLYASTNKPSGQGVVDSWASEVQWYHYDTNSCDPGKACGHYTQVVWHNTTKVGCGVARCTPAQGLPWSTAYIVTCNYAPGGNYLGQKPY